MDVGAGAGHGVVGVGGRQEGAAKEKKREKKTIIKMCLELNHYSHCISIPLISDSVPLML